MDLSESKMEERYNLLPSVPEDECPSYKSKDSIDTESLPKPQIPRRSLYLYIFLGFILFLSGVVVATAISIAYLNGYLHSKTEQRPSFEHGFKEEGIRKHFPPKWSESPLSTDDVIKFRQILYNSKKDPSGIRLISGSRMARNFSSLSRAIYITRGRLAQKLMTHGTSFFGGDTSQFLRMRQSIYGEITLRIIATGKKLGLLAGKNYQSYFCL